MAVYRQLALCARLKRMRCETGRTQKDVADYMGISQAAYSRLEKGEIDISMQKLFILSDLYRISVEKIIMGI